MTATRRADLIGVRFDGMGRPEGQARAPVVLREAGLGAAFGDGGDWDDVVAPPPDPERASPTGFTNQEALLAMVGDLHARTREALAAGRFPVVVGADCAVLLATVPALSEERDGAGLLFVDAHEDATPMRLSQTGEAANMEVSLLTGLGGERPTVPMPVRLPAIAPEAVAMLGPRDAEYRAELGVESVCGVLFCHRAEAVLADPAGTTADALEHLAARSSAWWLHVDFDVLSRAEFSACGEPGYPGLAGGLTWPALTTIVAAALGDPGCAGLSLAVYNPDHDPEREAARRIVEFAAEASAGRFG